MHAIVATATATATAAAAVVAASVVATEAAFATAAATAAAAAALHKEGSARGTLLDKNHIRARAEFVFNLIRAFTGLPAFFIKLLSANARIHTHAPWVLSVILRPLLNAYTKDHSVNHLPPLRDNRRYTRAPDKEITSFRWLRDYF